MNDGEHKGSMITVIGNMKGGTGKSTVSFNLAVWLAHQGKTVDLFDCDPQQTLADVLEVRAEESYTPELPAAQPQEALASITSPEDANHHILIDVSMSDQSALIQALQLADQVIIPIAPSQADIWSTQRFLKLIKANRETLPKLWGLINRADTHPFVVETKETEEAIDFLPHIERLPVRLHNRTAYRRSFSEGLGVFEMEPGGKASQEFIKAANTLFNHFK